MCGVYALNTQQDMNFSIRMYKSDDLVLVEMRVGLRPPFPVSAKEGKFRKNLFDILTYCAIEQTFLFIIYVEIWF